MPQPHKTACLACRARKVKCTPDVPRCVRCTALGIEECVYGQKKRRKVETLLGMGEACLPCRKQKRKCDAKRPCMTCIGAKRTAECVYDGLRICHFRTRKILPATVPSFAHGNENESQSSSSSSSKTLFIHEDGISRPVNSRLISFTPSRPCGLTSTNLDLSPPSSEVPITPNLGDPLPPGAPPVATSSDLVPFGRNAPKQSSYDNHSTMSFISSLLFPKVSSAPHVPLSFLGEPHLQVSHTTSGELELSFRLAGLVRMKKMGIHLTPPRQKALVDGDTSNVILHPFFVYKILSLGMHNSAILKYSPPMVLLHARYIQKFWEELVSIQQGNDLDLKVQTMFFLTSGCVSIRLVQLAHLYLWKTCKILNGADMRFIPKYGHPPPYSDEIHEKSTVLSQIVWMENYFFLTCGGERPKLTTRIEEEFRHELPTTYPVLFRMCPLTMRTHGILLVRDTVLLLERLHSPEERPKGWRWSCDYLASSLDDYSNTLMIHLGEFDKTNDTEGALIIRSSCIACLAHLAALYYFAGETQPSDRATMNDLCDAVLGNLGKLTQDTKLEEVTYFDLLLKYSWTKALQIYDSRIGCLSLEESAQLWCWKEIVAQACVDFERRIPKCEPPILAALALLEDGRSEGSKYPNFMVPAARESYGI